MPEGFHTGRYWDALEDGRIECRLCPRYCRLHDGQRGFCFVRQNINNTLVLTTYGRSSGFCIDPIEKKPLNHFLPGTSVLSFGTAGCNLGCKFCQNWSISKSKEFDRLSSLAMPDDIARAAKSHGCASVAFTYNDPVIFLEYAVDIAKACKEAGIKTVAVTAGYITPEAREEFFSHMDAANVDLKAFSSDFYKKIVLGKMDPVLETLKYLKHETDVWFEITTLLIEGENTEKSEIKEMCTWISTELGTDVPLHFTAFHPDFKMMDHPPTRKETLLSARDIALKSGLNHVYVGNVHDTKNSSTYCAECGHLLIGRDWYQLSDYNLVNLNHCNSCGSQCPGVFSDQPGNWGPRRQPIYINN